jgi:GDPmannose 4,6-dehydratase
MKEPRKALITGIGGQDGHFLASELASSGYELLGLTRPDAPPGRIRSPDSRVKILETDYSKTALLRIVEEFAPDEVYHFAAQPYVSKSWVMLDETIRGTALLTTNLLDALSRHPQVRLFNASSSEIYANSESPLHEDFLKDPTTPYGCAKLFAHQMVKAYRENYGIHATNGILFNHESELRSRDFFSQRLVNGVLDVYAKKTTQVTLGNLDVVRDWGSAREYVRILPSLLRLAEPVDVNICFGRGTSVLELVRHVFSLVDLDYQNHVVIDPNLVRNKEKRLVVGSNQRLYDLLGWKPEITIEAVLKDMLVHEARKRGINEIS